MNYSSIEKSLTENPSNLEQLVLTFFPTDKPKSIVVDVTYNIWVDDSTNSDQIGSSGSNETDSFYFRAPERVLRSATYDTKQWPLNYRWVFSSINMLVNPSLLKKLSLYAFQTEIGNASLNIEVPSGCSMPEVINETTVCGTISDNYNMIELLNQLTSNVSVISISIAT